MGDVFSVGFFGYQRKDFAPRRRYNAVVSVYVEVVLLNNLAIDALLIAATLTLRRRKIRKLRFLFAVCLCASIAVAYAVLPEVWQIVIRVVLAPVATLIFDKYKSVKDYIISLVLFAVLTFALGGAVSGIGYLTGIMLEGYLILGITAFAAFLMVIGVRLLLRMRANTSRKICTATVHIFGKSISVNALCDSGNTLTDGVSGLPVVIASEAFEKLVSEGEKMDCRRIEGFVELKTVSGEASLPIIGVEEIEVDGKRCKAYAALSGKTFDGYELILQNTMF